MDGHATSERQYDDLGRVIYQKRYVFGQNGETQNDYSLAGQQMNESYYGYNDNGHLSLEAAYDLQGSNGQTLTDYDDTTGLGYDSMGMLKGYRAELDGSNYIDYSYSYIGLSSRKVANIEAVRASAETNMLHTYDASGNLVKLENQHNENHDADELSANERTTNFSYNTQGQVLRKTTHKQGEFDADNTPTQRAQNFFFAKGSQIASSGNLDSNSVDQIFQPISQAYPGSAPGQYTVQHASETLESIANTLWGDASLWYLLADANGLGGSYSLYQGKTLIVPNSAVEAKNSHETFRKLGQSQNKGNKKFRQILSRLKRF